MTRISFSVRPSQFSVGPYGGSPHTSGSTSTSQKRRIFHVRGGALETDASAKSTSWATNSSCSTSTSSTASASSSSSTSAADEDLAAFLAQSCNTSPPSSLSRRLQQAVANKLFPLAFIRLVQQQALASDRSDHRFRVAANADADTYALRESTMAHLIAAPPGASARHPIH